MANKEDLITQKLDKIAADMQIDEYTMQKRIDQIKLRMSSLKDQTRMKSKIQSYDIRDCPEYEGILDLERLLRSGNTTETDFHQILNKGQKDPNKTANLDDADGYQFHTLNTSQNQNQNESRLELITANRPPPKKTRDIGLNINRVVPLEDVDDF